MLYGGDVFSALVLRYLCQGESGIGVETESIPLILSLEP